MVPGLNALRPTVFFLVDTLEIMTQAESRLSRKIMEALRLEGAFVFKVWGSEHMMAGLPDLIGCYKGRFFGFEVKMPEKRNNTSVKQDYVISLIRRAGGISQVVCNPQEALNALREQE
jgi:Holliday junction resolvase